MKTRWWTDRALWWALLVGVYLRFLPVALYSDTKCVRDECTYMGLAERILDGQGITPAAHGWLWAPAYPYFLALHEWLFGASESVMVTQVVLAPIMLVLAYQLGHLIAGRRTARVAVWLYALSPTLIFFTVSLWSESIYLTLLLGALLGLAWARQGPAWRGLVPGLLVGGCVLLRGVAQYLLPIFVVGVLWHRWRERRAWTTALALVVAAVLTVAPYSATASERWGGFILSDLTLGQMMYLGNNDFSPITFDHAVGVTHKDEWDRIMATGREHCDKELGPVAWDACERANGKAWISENPVEFVQRIPLRQAQLFNPNSFLTRRLRSGRWPMPDWLIEGLCGGTVGFSLLAVLGGSVALAARGRSWFALVTAGVLAYHVAAIALVAGLTRYRVPLDGLWLLWAAAIFGDPGGTFAALKTERWRTGLVLALLVVLIPLCSWYLRGGFR